MAQQTGGWTGTLVEAKRPMVPVVYGRTGLEIPGGGHPVRANATLALVEVMINGVNWSVPYSWDVIAVHLNEGVPLMAF